MTRDNDGNTSLHLACLSGHLNIAQYLISEVHCNPSCENNDGETPLHHAYRNGIVNIAEYLIFEEHCSVNNDGLELLCSACCFGNINIVKYLITL